MGDACGEVVDCGRWMRWIVLGRLRELGRKVEGWEWVRKVE